MGSTHSDKYKLGGCGIHVRGYSKRTTTSGNTASEVVVVGVDIVEDVKHNKMVVGIGVNKKHTNS